MLANKSKHFGQNFGLKVGVNLFAGHKIFWPVNNVCTMHSVMLRCCLL